MTARRPALSCAACVAATALVLLSLLMAHVDRGSVTVLASAAPFTARLLHTPGTAAAFTTTLGLVPPRLQRSAAPTTAARPRHPVARALPSSLRPTRSCSPCSYLSTVAVAAAALTAGAVVMLRARALASCRVRRSPLASHALCIASGARATDAWAHARPGATALSAYRDVGPGSVPGSDNVPLLLEAKSAFGAELREALRRDSGEFWALVEGRVAHLCAEDEDLSRGLGQATGDRAVLWERMRDVMLKERRQTLEDILYYNFVCECRGRDLRLQAPGDLKLNLHHDRAEFEAMLDSIHSAEARDVIQTNLVNLVQPKDFVLPPVVRVSRLQVAQLYHASSCFGYFVRRADKRFALARSAGLTADSVAGLSDYIEALAPATLKEMSRVRSREAASVMREYGRALIGDIDALATAMRARPRGMSVGEAVQAQAVDTFVLAWEDLLRLAQEAVLLGTFVRDAEDRLELHADRPLLTEGR